MADNLKNNDVDRIAARTGSASKTYSTGELASACEVSVRTVQYYDNKGLLIPSARSDGGRRVYTEEDAARLRFILMLKSFGLGLAQIKGVLESQNRERVLQLLLDERIAHLEAQLEEDARQLKMLRSMHADIELFGKTLAADETAMAKRMDDKNTERKWHAGLVILGILMDIAWIGTLILGILTGIWWPFPLALLFVAVAGFTAVRAFNAHLTYFCPACDAEFRPLNRNFFIARHTPKTRVLTCPCCHEKDWCVERFHAKPLSIAPGECMPGTCRRREDANACESADVQHLASEGGAK